MVSHINGDKFAFIKETLNFISAKKHMIVLTYNTYIITIISYTLLINERGKIC